MAQRVNVFTKVFLLSASFCSSSDAVVERKGPPKQSARCVSSQPRMKKGEKDVAKCQIYFGLENENLLRSFGKIKMKFSSGSIWMRCNDIVKLPF